MLPTVSGEFRVATDPELRFAPNGMAICKMRVVASKRKKNEQTQEWEDDKHCWLNAVVFRQAAENAAESYQKGDLIVLSGQLETEEWEDSEHNKRLSVNVLVNQIGMSTTFNSARSNRENRQRSGNGGGQQQQGQRQQQQSQQQDPWATNSGGYSQSDEPPF